MSQSMQARLFAQVSQDHIAVIATTDLLGLGRLNRALVEEATEERVQEGVEDDLGTTR